jgi:hypothetical protein
VPTQYQGNKSKIYVKNSSPSMFYPSPFEGVASNPLLNPQKLEIQTNNIVPTNLEIVNEDCDNRDNLYFENDLEFPMPSNNHSPDSSFIGQTIEAGLWWEQYNLYIALLAKDSLSNDEQNFRDSVASSALGGLEKALDILADTLADSLAALSQAKTINAAILVSNQQEENWQLANDLILEYYINKLDTIPYSTNNFNLLKQIAMLCPTLYGTGVYQARALLQAIDEDKLEYISDCEQLSYQNPNGRYGGIIDAFGYEGIPEFEETFNTNVQSKNLAFAVYPSPSDNELYVEHDLKDAFFELCDITGRIVFSLSENGAVSKSTLTVTNLANGIYILKCYSGKKLNNTQKIIVKH